MPCHGLPRDCSPPALAANSPHGVNLQTFEGLQNFWGSCSPPRTLPPHLTTPTACPRQPCALRGTSGLFLTAVSSQTLAAEPHVLLSHGQSLGFPNTPSPVVGGSRGVPKTKTHSSVLPKAPAATPSRGVFKRETKQQKAGNRRQPMTSLLPSVSSAQN